MDPRTPHRDSARVKNAVPPASSELREFLHDLNNLLGVVMGNAELLLDADSEESKRERRTQAIHTAATQAGKLVANMQDRL